MKHGVVARAIALEQRGFSLLAGRLRAVCLATCQTLPSDFTRIETAELIGRVYISLVFAVHLHISVRVPPEIRT
ncbi:hypothetical protein RB195_016361 [Necator americanus]|uniref:Uncharacterized protein n=1 Tax=Necator americanus TaxID=51031 RepID=A0ABR1E8S5_NECAM